MSIIKLEFPLIFFATTRRPASSDGLTVGLLRRVKLTQAGRGMAAQTGIAEPSELETLPALQSTAKSDFVAAPMARLT